VAPVLRDKHLEYYLESLPGAYNRAYFRYAPLQADAIWAKYAQMMAYGQISPLGGLRRIAHEINALEATAASEASTESHVMAGVRLELADAARAGKPVAFAVPPRVGLGAPPAPAPGLVLRSDGTITLSGAGSMAGGVSDAATFACCVAVASRATFSCRLVAVAALDGQTLQGGAKVGLMARADLSDNAPMVAIDLDGPNGVHIDDRPLPGVTQDHQHADGAGLPTGGSLVRGSAASGDNWLLRPVWFRWVRDDANWTAYTSFDGLRWRQAGLPVVGVQMAGAWVGLFVTSNNPPHRVRATFDHLTGLQPTTFVVLGGGA
jgi:hypothetical protein